MLQFSKAFAPIEMTPLPISTVAKAEHPQKASLPIEMTLLGILILVKAEHS